MLTIPQQVKIVMKRRVQILIGNSLATGMQLLFVHSLAIATPVTNSKFLAHSFSSP